MNPLQDAVIAISGRIADLCRDEGGRDPRSIHTVWYGCEDQAINRAQARASVRQELGLRAEPLLLGTVARLIDWKGHRYALEALASVRSTAPGVCWLFVGDGPERRWLEGLARSLGVWKHVRFLGQRDDVPRLMAALDLFVHPTTGEGFGLVLLEAMVQGIPILATRVGALPEIVVDGETGVLVSSRDAGALADALRALLADSRRRATLGSRGRRRYEEYFSVERMAESTVAVYRQVTGAS